MIDFFVHDMLDYAILRKKKQNFRKNIQVFDIKESVQQVIEILRDKAEMKEIEMTSHFVGFLSQRVDQEDGTSVNKLFTKTDMKRVQ